MNETNRPQTALALAGGPAYGMARNAAYLDRSAAFGEFDNEAPESGILEYLRVLYRNRLTIAISSLLCLILGVAAGIPVKPMFRATTSLEVLTLNEDFMNLKQATPTTASGVSDDISEEQTQAKLLQSEALIRRVIVKLDPTAPFRPPKAHLASSGWRSIFHLSVLPPMSPRLQAITAAATSLKVRPTAKTRILEISVDSHDAQLATDFANTLTEEFIAQTVESRGLTTQRTGEWLRRELDDARNKLRLSEDALQRYASDSGLIFTDESSNVATEKLQQVQQSLSAATADRMAKQSRYELAQDASASSLGEVLNDVTLRETQSKINDLKRQIADLRAVYSPTFSKVRRLQAELDALQPAFDRQRADIIDHIKNEYVEASRTEKLLSGAYNEQAIEVTGQDKKAIQYNILKRDVDSNRQLYDTMLQQMKQSSIASAMRASNVRVVDPAELPDAPFSPNFKLNAIGGFFGGFLLSCFAVIIRQHFDKRVKQPGDIKRSARLPELGIIPNVSFDARRFSDADRGDQLTPEGQAAFLGRLNASELVTWQNKLSVVAEAFHSALASILFVGETGKPPQVVLFTSANEKDGKTTVVSNIAIAAAETEMRVLVIDADLRRPRLHKLFNLGNEHGLSDLLKRDAEPLERSRIVQHSGINGLDVVTSGPTSSAAAHLLYSPHFGELLAEMREEYDMILIDTPPMLPMTDARVTARYVDAVILVARSKRTTEEALLAAKERFMEDNVRVLGAMLNDWDSKNRSLYVTASQNKLRHSE